MTPARCVPAPTGEVPAPCVRPMDNLNALKLTKRGMSRTCTADRSSTSGFSSDVTWIRRFDRTPVPSRHSHVALASSVASFFEPFLQTPPPKPLRSRIMAAALPFVIPLAPMAIPRLGLGFRRIAKKYHPKDVAPVKPVTNAEPFKGQFPERDVLGSSLLQHMIAATAIAQQLLLAALAIWEKDPNDPYALGLCLTAAAFVVDVATHAFLAGGDASAVDGTSCRRATVLPARLRRPHGAGNCLVVGEKIPRGSATCRHRLEDDGRAAHQRQGPRADQHQETAHGLGAFGLE